MALEQSFMNYHLKELERVTRRVTLQSQRVRDPGKRWVCKISVRVAGVREERYTDIPYYGGTPERAVERAYLAKFM